MTNVAVEQASAETQELSKREVKTLNDLLQKSNVPRLRRYSKPTFCGEWAENFVAWSFSHLTGPCTHPKMSVTPRFHNSKNNF